VRRLLCLGCLLVPVVFCGPASAAAPTIVFSSAWKAYVPVGDAPAHFRPAAATPGHPVTLVWSHEVAGNLSLTFGAVAQGTLLHVAFSETAEYLGIDGTSDWSRVYTSDGAKPTTGGTWVDRPGCRAAGTCGDGYRAFRFVRVYAAQGSARIASAHVIQSPAIRTPKGWFLSSDDVLNRAWYASAYTAQLMELPNDPQLLGLDCPISGPASRQLIIDGAKRDRCPWLGDQVVSDQALLLQDAANTPAVESTLSVFAEAQTADGYIPASPDKNYSVMLFDYPAYWVLALQNLLLYTGDRAYVARYWSNLVQLLDGWYPSHAGANGLLSDPFPPGDYAFIDRGGPVVAYYNALYDRALELGAVLATALGHADAASRWQARAAGIATAFGPAFWDQAHGAFEDSTTGPLVHPQDGNDFAVLAGLATPSQASSALAYLGRTTEHPWGNAIADNDTWGTAAWGKGADGRVYPFIGYFDVSARFAAGQDASAIDELRRTWGWMLAPSHQTDGTTWEAIGSDGSIDTYMLAFTSMASGWSAGAAPALTNDVLGVMPTGPGFSTFDAIPHPGGLKWAQGGVPTPRGLIRFGWQRLAKGYLLRLDAPAALQARVGAPAPAGATVLVDGRRVAGTAAGADVVVSVRGSHVIRITTP
jgi:Bacterial alpha-L-rhamnosidase 6 hairpin glycosidase domain/Bacterial alpha-L-rhamnosidase C-terminal domain